MTDDTRVPDAAVDDAPPTSEGSLYDALGLRDSGARILGVLIRLDAKLEALSARQEQIHGEIEEIDQRLDRWYAALSAISMAGSAIAKGAKSNIFWLLIGIAIGLGSLSIDAIGQLVAPILIGGPQGAP